MTVSIDRDAELARSSFMEAGTIGLSYSESIDAADDLITLSREYHSKGGSVHEDTYTVLRGGPGFNTFERAVNGQIPIEQAARWWDEYRDDYSVLGYRALLAVDEETGQRGVAGPPVTRDDVRNVLFNGDPLDARRQSQALEFAIRDGLLAIGADGGLRLTDAGRDTLAAIDNPSTLGESNRLLALGFSNPRQLVAASFAAAPTTAPRSPQPAGDHGQTAAGLAARAGNQHGRR